MEKQNVICVSRNGVRQKLSEIISEVMEEDFKLFEENTKLIDDIGLDSMGFLELSIQIQRTYGTLIDNEEWLAIAYVGDIINCIDSKLKIMEEPEYIIIEKSTE
jgi:acyl carrier protein